MNNDKKTNRVGKTRWVEAHGSTIDKEEVDSVRLVKGVNSTATKDRKGSRSKVGDDTLILDHSFDIITFLKPDSVELNEVDDGIDINLKHIYPLKTEIDFVTPKFLDANENIIMLGKVDSKVDPVGRSREYHVELLPLTFKSPPIVEVVEDVDSVFKLPPRAWKLEAKLVTPYFRELGSKIEPSNLIDVGIPEALAKREATRRTGVGNSLTLEPVSELVGLSDEFFELELFGVDVEDDRRIYFGDLITLEKPVVVLLPHSKGGIGDYENLLLLLLREAYRMASGGLPRPLVISEPMNIPSWRLDEVRAGKSISFIDFTSGSGVEYGLFRDKVAELFSQGFGFLVIYYEKSGENEALKLLYRVSRELSTKLHPGFWEEHIIHGIPAYVVRVKPKVFTPGRIDLAWGQFTEPGGGDSSKSLSKGWSVNLYTLRAEKRYYRIISRIAASPVSQVEVPVNPDGETLVHYALKSISLLYIKYYLKDGDAVAESDCGVEGVRVDVCSKDVIVEVETLYGRGLPLRRLVEIVESRKQLVESGRTLWILIPPPQASLLPRKWVKAFREYVKKQYPGRIKLATIDINHSWRMIKLLEGGKEENLRNPNLKPIRELTP